MEKDKLKKLRIKNRLLVIIYFLESLLLWEGYFGLGNLINWIVKIIKGIFARSNRIIWQTGAML